MQPSISSAARIWVHAFFFLSGASALAYEILWTRQMTLVVGASTPAVSTVLAVFMGGLALGARYFGPLADRSRNLLRFYGLMELGIGLYALVQPLLLIAATRAYVALVPSVVDHSGLLMIMRAGFAGLILLPPTLLMGGTFPVLLRFLARREISFGLDLGWLYAANLAGAVLGCGLTGFILIRALGMTGSLLAAVGVNLGVGAAALLWGRSLGSVDQGQSGSTCEVPPPTVPAPKFLLWTILAGSGFLTMGYEVTWSRMLVFVFGSTTYAFTLILIVFLLGLSFGSALFARLEHRLPALHLLAASLVLAGTSALALGPVAVKLPEWIRAASHLLGFTPLVQLGATFVGSLLVMLLPAIAMGVVFPLVCRLLVGGHPEPGRRLGQAYLTNTFGSIAGSLLVGFLLIPLLSIKGCLLALSVIQALLGFALVFALPARGKMIAGAATLLLPMLTGILFLKYSGGPSPFDRVDLETGWTGARIEAHRDDVDATVTVVKSPAGVKALRINGFMATEDGEGAAYMPMMSHLPMLLHGHAKRVLVVCFGTGSTAGAVLLHPAARVDAVDINRTVLDFAPHFEHINQGVFRDERARLIHEDGRNHLLASPERYDVITSEPMPPTHAGVVNLYSREYYELCWKRLNPGGLVVQWLPFHLVSPEETRSILRTVQEVFPETTLWLHSNTGLVVARKGGPLEIDWETLTRAFADPRLAKHLVSLQIPRPEELAQLQILDAKGVRSFAGDAPVVSDDHPSLEFHPPRHRTTLKIPGRLKEIVETHLHACEGRPADPPPIRNASAADLAHLRARWKVRGNLVVATTLMKLGRLDDAIRLLNQGLGEAPIAEDRALCYYNLAMVSMARSDRKGALVLAERCLAEAPNSANARKLVDSLRISN